MSFNIKKYNTKTFGGLIFHLMLAVIVIAILAVIYFYAYLPAITNKGQSITVPSVEGMQVRELEDFLGNRNLRWEVNDSSYSEKYPPLTVLRQFPAPGSKVKENRKIYISINRINPPTVPVPNLIDGSVINAEAVLKGNELKRGNIELTSGPWLNVVKGMKFEGRPIEAGTRIPKGSVIDLVVMDGGNRAVEMPYVIGQTLEDAKIPILGSNLNIGNIIGNVSDPEAVVIKQKPAAYENIRVGDVVDLWIGPRNASVPDDDEDD